MIRPYKDSDLAEVLLVWDRATALGHAFLPAAFLEQERRQVADAWLEVAETSVWESGGRVVGFISMLGDEIGGLFVDPAFGRRGIGRQLIDHARVGRDTLTVRVFAANQVGRAFYAGCGFVTVGQAVHEESSEPEILLRLGRTRG